MEDLSVPPTLLGRSLTHGHLGSFVRHGILVLSNGRKKKSVALRSATRQKLTEALAERTFHQSESWLTENEEDSRRECLLTSRGEGGDFGGG